MQNLQSTILASGVFKISCQNGTLKILHGENVQEIEYLSLKKPMTKADLSIYPNLTVIHIYNSVIDSFPENLLQGEKYRILQN